MTEEHGKKDGPEWKMIGGGSPVMIDDDGEILMGCPGLKGEDIDDLGEHEDPENRAERDRRQERAEAIEDASEERTENDPTEADEETVKPSQPDALSEPGEDSPEEESIDLGDEFDDDQFDTSFGFGANAGDDEQDDEESLFDPADFEDDQDDQIWPDDGEEPDEPPSGPSPTPEATTTESPQDSIGDARAATGAAIDQIPAGPVRSLVESLHDLREVRKTGKTTTTEVDPDYSKSIYDHLKKITRNGDGFGEVYDLADHLGPRALGYASPAGVLAMIPPKFKGDDWEVRYAATQQSPDAPLAGTGQVYDTEDEPATASPPTPEPQPKPTGRERTSTPRRPRGVRGDSKLANIIRDVVGDDPADQEAFRDIINEVWQRKRREVADHNYALSQVVGMFKSGNSRGGFTRKVRGADDGDQIRAFDQLVDYAEREYPYLLTRGVAGEGGTYDPESRLRQVIAEGVQPYPAKHDDDVIGEALDFASRAGGEGASYMDPEYAEELAAMSFSRRGEWKVRYRKWATGKLSRWREFEKRLHKTHS